MECLTSDMRSDAHPAEAGRAEVLDYASVAVGPRTRYSIPVVISFILAIALPLLVLRIGFPVIGALPRWITLTIPLVVFATNFASAFHLLDAPKHVLGDGLVASGVFISGI